MREFKFRAWDAEAKKWLQITGFETKETKLSDGYTLGGLFHDGDYVGDKGIILMQCTGLKDKRGKEIYEGDVCQLGTTNYQVVWMDRYAKYGAKVIKTETVLAMGCTFPMQDYVVFSSGRCEFEIIGNIYENPELLEANT